MPSKKIIYPVAGILIFLVIYFLFFTNKGFGVTGYSPTLNNMTTITPYIDIYFNETVSESDLSISSPDNIITRYILQSPDDIRVYLIYPLNNNQRYKIILEKIISSKGSEINNKTVSFVPLYTDPSFVPKAQIKYEVSQQDKPLSEVYGTTLVNLLPYISPGFVYMISYNIVNTHPAIVITSATSSGVNEAETWIANEGYDTTHLNIQIVNQQPE